MNNIERRNQILLIPFVILFVGLLAIYGVKGFYSRYAQDDYCYGYRVMDNGFWNAQIQSYLHKAEFVSNRFSTTFAHSLVQELGGPAFMPFLTTLEILMWLGSLLMVMYQLQVIIYSRKNVLLALVSSLVILFFTLYLAPDHYQVLFWLAAIQTYMTPMILATLLLGYFLILIKKPSVQWYHALGLFLLCFFAGGFSETTALWQFEGWCLLFIGTFLQKKKPAGIFTKTAWKYALIATIATAVALAFLVFSPSNGQRVNLDLTSYPILIWNSLIHGAEYLWYTFKGSPLPFLVLALFGFLLRSLLLEKQARKHVVSLFEILILFVVLYAIAVANMIPIKLSGTVDAYPSARSLLPSLFSLVIFFFIAGWKLANFALAIKPQLFVTPLSQILVSLLAIFLFAYTIRTAPRIYDKLPLYASRAAAWDQRQQIIFDEKATGKTDIIIPQFDSVYGITEITPDPNNWVNVCAAKYYDVNSITAIEDYMGIPAFPIGK